MSTPGRVRRIAIAALILAVAWAVISATGSPRRGANETETRRGANGTGPRRGASGTEQEPAETGAEEKGDGVYRNTVKWATASEVDNFGYDVYRGESEDGPFERINPEVIEGAGTSDEPNHYRYVDDTIDPRKTYFYYVESIAMSGVRERFTPIAKAPPKISEDREAAEQDG